MKVKSVGMIIPNMWENKGHVPKHQPALHCIALHYIAYICLHLVIYNHIYVQVGDLLDTWDYLGPLPGVLNN